MIAPEKYWPAAAPFVHDDPEGDRGAAVDAFRAHELDDGAPLPEFGGPNPCVDPNLPDQRDDRDDQTNDGKESRDRFAERQVLQLLPGAHAPAVD